MMTGSSTNVVVVTALSFFGLALFLQVTPVVSLLNNSDNYLIASWVQHACPSFLYSPLRKGSKSGQSGEELEMCPEVRAVVNDTDCPKVDFDGESVQMSVRATPTDNHPNTVCSAAVPSGVKSIILAGESLPTPKKDPEQIAVMGDSGCRLGTAHGGLYQSCLNPSLWPFERICKSVSETKPDVILYTGDYIYREGQCIKRADGEEIPGCKNSPYHEKHADEALHKPNPNDKFETWKADWFDPAKKIFKAAPLVLSRGNHETCNRSGLGFMRYLYNNPPPPGHQCLDSLKTNPFIVEFKDFQVGVMDTSTPGSRNNTAKYAARWTKQLDMFDDKFTKSGILLTHWPFYAMGTADEDISGTDHPKGPPIYTESLQLGVNMTENGLKGMAPEKVKIFMGAHIHLAEIVGFEGNERPPQLVIGNSGTQLVAPFNSSEYGNEIAGVKVDELQAVYQYGFATMTRKKGEWNWSLEFKDRIGRTIESCSLKNKEVVCSSGKKSKNSWRHY